MMNETATPLEILLVEDDPNDVELTLHALRQHHIANHVQVVRDGAQALDFIFGRGDYANLAPHNVPKVILLDLKLPKVDGLQVLEQIKADLADGIQLEKYFDELCKKAVRPTEDDLLVYYQEHPEQFFVPEQVDASHILQQPSESNPLEKVYAELLNLLERLKAGEDFDALAREHSHCQDGSHHLGYFTRGQMVQAFEEVAFSTPIGEWSKIFQTEFGYHILMVHDRKPEATLDFEEVRYDIEAMLQQRGYRLVGISILLGRSSQYHRALSFIRHNIISC